MIPSLMGGGRPRSVPSEKKIIVELPSDAEFAIKTLTSSDAISWMMEALERSFGGRVELEYRLGNTPAQPVSAPIAEPAQKPANAPQPDAVSAATPDAYEQPSSRECMPQQGDAAQFALASEFASEPAAESELAFEPAYEPESAFEPAAESESASVTEPASAPAEAKSQIKSKPSSGDTELASMIEGVFGDGVVYRDPADVDGYRPEDHLDGMGQ